LTDGSAVGRAIRNRLVGFHEIGFGHGKLVVLPGDPGVGLEALRISGLLRCCLLFQGRNKGIKVGISQSTGKWKSSREFEDGLTQTVSLPPSV